MIAEAKCSKRNCKHYEGVKWFGEEESSENHYCKAFPEGIPYEISGGKDKHKKPLPGQENDLIYEKEEN